MRNKKGGENKGMRNKRGGEVDSVRGSLSVHSGALLRLSTPLGGCQGGREGGREGGETAQSTLPRGFLPLSCSCRRTASPPNNPISAQSRPTNHRSSASKTDQPDWPKHIYAQNVHNIYHNICTRFNTRILTPSLEGFPPQNSVVTVT